MKKMTALVIAVLFVLFLAGTVYADDITVTVTMATYTLRVTSTTWAIGTVTPSLDTARQSASFVANDGGTNMDVTLLCGDGANWYLAGTAAKDTFQMRAIFSHPDTSNAFYGADGDSFLASDDLTGSPQEGTNALFYTTNCGSGADAGGLDIAASDSVALWLWFKAPTTSTTITGQSIAVTVGGTVAE